MKKLLLTLSLVASVASVSADPTAPAALSRFEIFKTNLQVTAKNSRAGKFVTAHPVASKRAGYVAVTAVVAVAAKKAYDRYKAWKKAKADKNEDVATA